MESPTRIQDSPTETNSKPSVEITLITDTAESTSIKPVKVISCTQCQCRKIKCDKVKPACSHCVKSKIGVCEYRPPAPPRRGKRKPTEADLLSRLQRYEDLLRDSGFKLDDDETLDRENRASPSNEDLGRPSKKRQTSRISSNGTTPLTVELPVRSDGCGTGDIIVEEEGSRYVESDLWRGIGAVACSPLRLHVANYDLTESYRLIKLALQD